MAIPIPLHLNVLGLFISIPLTFQCSVMCPHTAYCDVAEHLSCHSWLVRESQRYGDKWTKKWAQEKALKLVTNELPAILASHAHPLDHTHFPTWSDFLAMFVDEGGLIEGTPPSESVTSLTVDLLIEPTGVVNIVSMRDQVGMLNLDLCIYMYFLFIHSSYTQIHILTLLCRFSLLPTLSGGHLYLNVQCPLECWWGGHSVWGQSARPEGSSGTSPSTLSHLFTPNQ